MNKKTKSVAEWKKLVEDFQKPNRKAAIWQLVNTLGPLAGVWTALYFVYPISWLFAIPLAILGGLFLVRAFIIFHDCGHGSFFRSKKANDVLGFITGMLTFTPYHHWKWEHAMHHATTGDLDRRGIGDVWTLTVKEYLASSRTTRINYRLVRNPFILFVFAPLFLFFRARTFSFKKVKTPRKTLGYDDESSSFDLGCMHECNFWVYSLVDHSIGNDVSSRMFRSLALLCTAPI
jgi:omega-6 fatty acid desaturase (delta-12 desaturase)